MHLALAVVLSIFGFLVAAGFVQEGLREEAEPARVAELERLIEGRRGVIDELANDVATLSRRVERLHGRAAGSSQEAQAALRQVDSLAGLAGLAGVEGPGVIVELADSPDVPRTRAEETDFRIQDTDLQLVVNALWRAGAEAIAVNGTRILSTTAIRAAGSAILINYRGVASPYRVAAVGSPDQLFAGVAGSEIAQQFGVWRQIYGLGFGLETADTLTLPAFRGLSGLRWARPAGGPV
jgi:uncharacterized protein YlxW (UPF0749 family)